jgi:SAM-dependent methyltransferase
LTVGTTLGRSAKRAVLRSRFPFRAQLIRFSWRSYQGVLAARESHRDRDLTGSDGLPLPPARLRLLATGTPSHDYFLRSGRAQAAFIRSLVERNGVLLEQLGAVLDFGCGCGRVTRWWSGLDGPEVDGCDYNPELARWCARNLLFMQATVNGIEPPLPYPGGRFDLAYALSVFTHLPRALERKWLRELERIIRPGGLLFLTTHGEFYAELLSRDERAAFARGEPVTHFRELPGTNLCATYHPHDYVARQMLAGTGLELVDSVLGTENPAAELSQDSYVLRRRA